MEIEIIEPAFIRMGADHLINLNAVQQIRLIKVKDGNDAVTFIFTDEKTITFVVESCESICDLVKVPYTLSTKY